MGMKSSSEARIRNVPKTLGKGGFKEGFSMCQNGLCFLFKERNVLQLQTDLSELLWCSEVTHQPGQYKPSS